jgi:signal peptidase I
MNFDLELILLLATIISGTIVWLNKLRWAPKRLQNQQAEPWYVDQAKSFFPILIIVLILRSFIAEPFRIPSGSMMPTLLHGDFILVNKFAYGVRLPVSHTEIFRTGQPERGDVAVFRYPKNPSLDYIKRVIGLPGDVIEYRNKQLFINQKRMPQIKIGHFIGQGRDATMTGAEQKVENLQIREHQVLLSQKRFPINGAWQVPEGHYFVMGDNRDNSNDSRYWGMVPEANLVGKAFFIWLSWDFAGGQFNAHRIGTSIK